MRTDLVTTLKRQMAEVIRAESALNDLYAIAGYLTIERKAPD